jgi:hypothetical protein
LTHSAPQITGSPVEFTESATEAELEAMGNVSTAYEMIPTLNVRAASAAQAISASEV